MKLSLNKKILFIAIFLLAAFFRFYGINWDQNQHLHQDERFLTMVSLGISWPKNINEYFNTNSSPLNPHNRGFSFFVYGTFPLFITKFVAEALGLGNYNDISIVGRQLSALADLGTVFVVFLIAQQLYKFQAPNNKNQINSKHQTTNYKKFVIWNLEFGIFPLLAMFLYSIMVLPIQLSHFFAVDTYLTFFIVLSFYFLVRLLNLKSQAPNHKQISNPKHQILNILNLKILNLFGIWNLEFGIYIILLGISFGLAIASKISAVLFLPIIALGYIYFFIKNRKTSILFHCFIAILFIVSFYFTLRLAQPYLFSSSNIFGIELNPKVLDNWKELKSFDNPNAWFPPGVQWIHTVPYIYPLKNLVFWGLGLPLGVISILAILHSIISLLRYYIITLKKALSQQFSNFNNLTTILTLITLWVVFFFVYQGAQFGKNMRYFHPIYPFLAILSAWFIIKIFQKFKIGSLGYWIIGLLIIVYPLSFISIYSRPITRVTASQWIYQNIPEGSVIANEYWDDPLPLNLPNYSSGKYTGIMLPLYDQDTPEKWDKIAQELEKIDYVILSSNRLYGSITTVPEKYPLTNRYYQTLFDGSLGFQKVAEFTSRPNIPLPFLRVCLTPPFARYGIIAKKDQKCSLSGISFVDDYADESFTVYDHPKVIIFKKIRSINYLNILYDGRN